MKIDENTTYQIMWDVATAVSRGELIALHSYIRNEQRSHINDFRTHIKKLEEVEQIKNEISKNMKINIRAEINEIESRKTIETMKWNAGSLKKIKKIDILICTIRCQKLSSFWAISPFIQAIRSAYHSSLDTNKGHSWVRNKETNIYYSH